MKKCYYIAGLFVLVFLSFFLRLYWTNLTIMEGDMFRDFTIAEDILKGNLRYTGVGSLDQLHHQQSFGPLMYYFIAFILYLFKTPIAIAFFVGILNTIAVLITFKFCKEYFNERIAFITSFLYAVNPWAVYISSFHWNPNYLPFFSVIFFYFLFGFVLKNKDNYLIYCSFILAIMLNFHLTALFFIIILVLIIILFRRDVKFKFLFYSLFAFIIPFLPFLYYNIINKISIFGPIFYGVSSREYSGVITGFVQSFGIPFMLATNYLGKYVYGNSFIFLNNWIKYLLFSLTILISFLLICALFFAFNKIKNFNGIYSNKKISLLLILFFIFPIIHFLRFSDVSPHYFFIMYPVQFVLIAIFVSFLLEKINKFRNIIISLFVLILLLQVFNIFLLFNYVAKNGPTELGEFSIPYKTKIDIINYIKKDANGKYINIIFFRNDKGFKYLLEKNIPDANYIYANFVSDLKNVKNSYLILDRFSMHRINLSDEEKKYFENMNKTIIKKVEIYKI